MRNPGGSKSAQELERRQERRRRIVEVLKGIDFKGPQGKGVRRGPVHELVARELGVPVSNVLIAEIKSILIAELDVVPTRWHQVVRWYKPRSLLRVDARLKYRQYEHTGVWPVAI